MAGGGPWTVHGGAPQGGDTARRFLEWFGKRIRITQSTSGAESPVPLVAPVGDAVLDYLRHVRPKSEHRAVFLRVRVPHPPFARGSSLHPMITRRLQRAGIALTGRRGAHAFRSGR